MPTPNTSITSSGTYLINGNFDEVTGAIITNGLVVYLDAGRISSGASTGTIWLDVASNYLSTLTNVTYSNTGSGSIYFTNNSLQVATLYSLTGTFWSSATWTVSVWTNISFLQSQRGGGDNAFLAHGATLTDQGLHLGERGGFVYFGFYGDDMGGSIALSTSTWNNIVWQYNPTTRSRSIYVNGRLDITGTATGYYSNTLTNTEIGRYPWSTTQVLSGYISQVAIYNRTLLPLEISRNYQTLQGRYTTTGTYTRSRIAPGIAYYDQLDEVTYNPNNGVPAINQFAYSQYFTSTNWVPGNAFVILNTSTITAPDGSLTATKLVDIAGAGYHNLSYTPTFSFSTGSIYNFSVYVKAEEISSIGVYLPGGNSGAKYNISTGALIGNDTGITSSITAYPNGWWRINATYTSVLTVSASPTLYMMNPTTAYTAVGGQGLYIWGAQFELNATTASIYVATTASGVKSTYFAQRTDNQGSAYVANYFDEVTGMIVTNGLIASWDASKLASYPGSGTKWTDISGNGNDITLNGTYTYNTGTSFNMAGTGNAISGNNLLNGLASSATNFTVNVWFNYASTTSYTSIFEKQSGVGGGIPRMDIGFGGGAFYWTTWYQPTAVVHDLVYSGTILSPNTWYQTTLTCSSSGNKSVYINGQFITSATLVASWPDGTQTLGIGGSQRKINGQIGETQIYNRALTAVEVASNFNNTRTRYGV